MSQGIKRSREQAIVIGEKFLKTIGIEDIGEAVLAGSIRRELERVGDIDIVVKVVEGTRDVLNDRLKQMFGGYKTKPWKGKRTGEYGEAQINVIDVLPHQFGAALLHATGSAGYNVILRNKAISKGWLLNQYGLFDRETNKPVVNAADECKIQEKLGVTPREPKDRDFPLEKIDLDNMQGIEGDVLFFT